MLYSLDKSYYIFTSQEAFAVNKLHLLISHVEIKSKTLPPENDQKLQSYPCELINL